MTPLIQSNKKCQYLFIALLLASFASAPSGRAQGNENQPNKRMFRFNVTRGLQCAGGSVNVRGLLVVVFKPVPDFELMPAIVRLDEFTGTAAAGNRKLTVLPKDVKLLAGWKIDTRIGEGQFGIGLKINGPALPGGAPLRLRLALSPIVYKFNEGKVTRIIPDNMPNLSCLH